MNISRVKIRSKLLDLRRPYDRDRYSYSLSIDENNGYFYLWHAVPLHVICRQSYGRDQYSQRVSNIGDIPCCMSLIVRGCQANQRLWFVVKPNGKPCYRTGTARRDMSVEILAALS